jgi:hypothetical protein
MKRRTAIRNVVLVTAGTAFLYSCKEKPASMTLKHIPLTGAEEDMLAELTETIIPRTDFPGAKDLKTGDFVLMMSDDLLPPEAQQKFSAGMKAFTEAGFANMSQVKRKEFIDKLDGDPKAFFEMVKQGTIYNFTTSERYLKDVKNITSLIPPKFEACVEVKS